MQWNHAEVLKAVIACAICLGYTVGWIHFSLQKKVPRSLHHSLIIGARLAIMLATVFLVFCAWLGVPVNYLVIFLAVLLVLSPLASLDADSAMNRLAGDAVGFALSFFVLLPVFAIKQFVLGFPERDHVVLSPSTPLPKARSGDAPIRQNEPAAAFEGFATVVATLKPMGTIEFRGARSSATSIDGTMIDVGCTVRVCGQSDGVYRVCLSNETREI